ncbi:MAG: nucleotide exchange factor GrpE [Ginsengibacter sp.]|jgi:molecular chaperone GrpE
MSKNHINNQLEENEEEEMNPTQRNEENVDDVEPTSEDNSDELENVKNALEEQKDKYIRLFAEFDNYKRRTSKEMIDIRLTAAKDLIVSLLDVLDDMDRAEEQMSKSESDPQLVEGTLLIFNKLRRLLEAKGLKAFETLHTEFDVEKDEAISEMPVEDKKLKGKVVAEVQKGYLLNDKLIRYAKVVVGK